MPQITVTTTITTVFDVPDGVPIERIRHLGLPVLSEDEESSEELFRLQQRAICETFSGDEEPRIASVEHEISELTT
ncbi:hypothetical protein [Pseudomonas fragariae (ex Marin et al. 2024)]|uniref:hypothetical protein n=1 Tax=Pseudomonas fragariae (ex Marin et al. 2024) TaxID=3080056 RepID=UPI002A23F843|nr:hypothetical protein [Pseudomonas sp. 20]MDX9624267.1 hypothetical protein [Pseudomonas sp. 20]